MVANKKLNIAVTFLIIIAVFFSTISFANAKETLTKEYKFTAKNEDSLSYTPEKEIKVKGVKYKLSDNDIKYEIIESNKITEKKEVTVTDKENVEKTITKDGRKLTLKDVDLRSETDKKTVTKNYDSLAKAPASLRDSKTVGDTNVTITLNKSNVSEFKTPQSFTAPAYFTGHPQSSSYKFNGKSVTLENGTPTWTGWKNDIANYLGLNSSYYQINSIKWQGDFVKNSSGSYDRTAIVTGTRYVPTYTVTYVEDSSTATIYAGTATYEGVDNGKDVIAKAIVTYERDGLSTVQKAVLIGAGVLVLTSLFLLILLYLKRKRNN